MRIIESPKMYGFLLTQPDRALKFAVFDVMKWVGRMETIAGWKKTVF